MESLVVESQRRHRKFHADIARKAEAMSKPAKVSFATFGAVKVGAPVPKQVLRARSLLSEMYAYECAWHLEIAGVELGPENFPEPPSVFPGPSVRLIQEVTCDVFGVHLHDMLALKRGGWRTSHVRGIAMYIAKHVAKRSYPDIAHRFNRGDHTTALHAVRRVSRLMQTDRELADEIAFITDIVERLHTQITMLVR